jgi:hypothetical protein
LEVGRTLALIASKRIGFIRLEEIVLNVWICV